VETDRAPGNAPTNPNTKELKSQPSYKPNQSRSESAQLSSPTHTLAQHPLVSQKHRHLRAWISVKLVLQRYSPASTESPPC